MPIALKGSQLLHGNGALEGSMATNLTEKTIRIVKKPERAHVTAKPRVNTARQVTREMVGTVTNWVLNFQQKRRNETASALRILSTSSSSVKATRPR